MDQEAFRQLISSSSAVPASSTKRTFGKAPKRNPTASTSTLQPSDLKPSSQIKSNYIDRASARRSGRVDSEFSEIESLYRDFEQRIAAAETEKERQTLRDQISSVGGDARYSVLVKGLDWSLLAQNKARIEREKGGTGVEEHENELESAYREGRAETKEATKRSREEIVEAIRRRREAKSSGLTSKEVKPASGFRPIGLAGDKTEREGEAEYKWVDGKRMRKKRKPGSSATDSASGTGGHSQAVGTTRSGRKVQDSKETAPPHSSTDDKIGQSRAQELVTSKNFTSLTKRDDPVLLAQAALDVPASSANDDKSSTPTSAYAEENKTSIAAANEDDEDEDEDIFSDVGGWDGIPESKEDDEEEEDQAVDPVTGALLSANRVSTPPQPASPSPPSHPTEPALLDAPQPIIASLSTSTSPFPAADQLPHPTFGASKKSVSVSPPPASASEMPPTTQTSTPDAPAPRSKKSKWDDDDDARTKKKKKKKH